MHFIFSYINYLNKFVINFDNNELDNFYRAHFV